MDEEKKEFLSDYSSLDVYFQEAVKAVANVAKSSNGIPSDTKDNWDFYSTFTDFRKVMNVQSDQVRSMIENILLHNGVKVHVPKNSGVTTKVEDILEMLAEANDNLLERIQTNLDEADGLKKEIDPVLVGISTSSNQRQHISGSWNKKSTSSKDDDAKESIKLLAAKNITRPQLKFKEFIDNRAGSPFIPRLKEKPHALKPLSILIEYNDNNDEFYSHPYLFEIDNVKMNPRQLQSRPETESRAKALEETELIYVDTVEKLKLAIEECNKFSEIGVDLEAHNYRSFQGITCLIQMSTREKDYIIDPFPLWGEMTCLNEIMANPKIVKIFHGSYKDIVWLQRDFSVYVVNMFDSYVACLVLGFPPNCKGLKHLLMKYANVETNKEFQLADWRIRPIPGLMLKYARIDTHHLIDIYHDMKSELISKSNENLNLLKAVYEQSNHICKQRHEKQAFHPDQSFLEKMQKMNLNSLNSRQSYAFKEIFNWRNQMARQEDESEMFVLKDHELISICSNLPRELQGILALCNPVPPLVRQNLVILHEFILKAREQPLGVNLKHDKGGQVMIKPIATSEAILENPLRSPLDTCHLDNNDPSIIVDQLPCLISKEEQKRFHGKLPINKETNDIVVVQDEEINKLVVKEPQVGVFVDKVFIKGISPKINISCVSPFDRYEKTKTMMEEAILTNENKTDEDRIKSIQEHFSKLTQITPQDLQSEKSETKKEDIAADIQESSGSEDDEAELDHFDPDPSSISDDQIKKANKRPAKQVENDENIGKKSKLQVENVDFSQYSAGVNPKTKSYDPSKNQFRGSKNSNASKAKQRYKKSGSFSGKSVTYKK